jgi:hypothetical protein
VTVAFPPFAAVDVQRFGAPAAVLATLAATSKQPSERAPLFERAPHGPCSAEVAAAVAQLAAAARADDLLGGLRLLPWPDEATDEAKDEAKATGALQRPATASAPKRSAPITITLESSSSARSDSAGSAGASPPLQPPVIRAV